MSAPPPFEKIPPEQKPPQWTWQDVLRVAAYGAGLVSGGKVAFEILAQLPFEIVYVLPPSGVATYWFIRQVGAFKKRRSPITILEDHLTLELLDREGKAARLGQTTYFKANTAPIEKYVHRFHGDGKTDPPEIRLGDRPSTISNPYQDMGKTCYDHVFTPPLQKGYRGWQIFNCMIRDAFPQEQERFGHEVDYPARQCLMKVIFPRDRYPKQAARLALRRGLIEVTEATVEPTTRDDGRREITFNIKSPALGDEYYINWTW